ncbi:MAG TPA: phosphonoacetaldehyde hydrolase [Vicinamibacterales bacterium]
MDAPSPPGVARAERLKAVVLDWAGTTVDFGSLAPARMLQRTFASVGIDVTDAEVRADMGLPKKDHVRRILSGDRVSDEWRKLRGRPPEPADVDDIYERFVPLQLSCLVEYSSLIPGVLDSVRRCRDRGLKIGSTTGYTRAMLDVLLESSAKDGYRPDCSIAPEDVGGGRPAPFMIFEIAVRLKVYPLSAIAKIGDTPADILEGLNAGAWTIGVAGTGNGIGLSREEFDALAPGRRESLLERARFELRRAGAHFVIDTLAELDSVLDQIDARLRSRSPE